MTLDFKIEKSGIPIYLQLKEQIKLEIATGGLEPGTQMPTVRQLAVQLEINANTVSRVYSALEDEGYLLSQQGRGTFVANTINEKNQEKDKFFQEHLEHLIENVVVEAYRLGYSVNDIISYLKQRAEGGGGGESK
ncbi:MAG: GntR family transcriptional regulator [Bacillota bacterium]|nr:GntR family transcriptional regulator [Bacillota bacterium]